VFANKKIVTVVLGLMQLSVSCLANPPLKLSAFPGKLIHDASYLPRPDFWPPDLPWDGADLNSDTSYRYAPSLIRYNGNRLHFWACSEGDTSSNIADYIRYKHSTNGGLSWSEEKIALAPSVGAEDGWAVCDPNVIRVGAYYYMAYTATNDASSGGLSNQVFVARSTAPDAGFQKWNGSGWGGAPKPIITYTGVSGAWGMGEPNMVVKGNTLYLYYTESIGVSKTRVATAVANHANWPATLRQRGYAIETRDIGEGQTDVKYLPEVKRFIATAIGRRFDSSSYVHVWESSNGLRFQPILKDVIRHNIKPFAHNLGMSGSYLGHAFMGQQEFIAYAYTASDGYWGHWNTWLNKIDIRGGGWIKEKPDTKTMTAIFLLLFED